VPERSETPRVVVVDDHPLYRQGLARLLVESGIDVVAEAGNGLEAITAVEEHAPDVVVVDLNMPGMSGVEVTRRLIERAPASRVLVLSVSAQEGDVTEALLAGASGYILKESPVQEVVAGIHAAAVGESLVSPRIASMLLRKARDWPSQRADRPSSECDWPLQEAVRRPHRSRGESWRCSDSWPTARPTTRSPRHCTSASARSATTFRASL
jgi:DNA-binding NarL/FixJ family response regulator